MKSLGSSSFATRAAASGSFRRSQSSFGAWKPVLARLPVIAITRSRPSRALDLVAFGMRCAHRSRAGPGGSASPSRSRNTEPCIWPERPTAAMSWPCAAAHSCCSTVTVACHQASGSCSVQPGRGVSKRVGRGGAREHGAVRREKDALGAAGADVDADGRWLRAHVVFSSPVGSGRPDFTRHGPSSIACDRFAAAVPPTSLYETATPFVPCRSRARRRRPSRPAQGPDAGGVSCACSTMPASG